MIDDGVVGAIERRGEMALGDGHPDGVGEALAERARGGFDAGCVTELGVTGRRAAPLAESSDLFKWEIVTAEMEGGVEQHRRVPAREHDAVAVGPRRIGGIVFDVARPEHVREWRERHRRAGVS